MKLMRNLGLIAILILLITTDKSMAQTAKDALNVGDKAGNFTLKNALGNEVTLYDELKNGPVVLTWYRGGWCPYCNIALSKLQSILPEIKAAGATLIALSPQIPDQSMATKEKQELEFEVLSDIGNKVGKEYKIVFKLDDATHERYESGFGLSDFNGDSEGELPIPVTYVVGTDKIIKYAFVDDDYSLRADNGAIIDELNKIKAK